MPINTGQVPPLLDSMMISGLAIILALGITGLSLDWPPAVSAAWRAAWLVEMVLLAIRASLELQRDRAIRQPRPLILFLLLVIALAAGIAAGSFLVGFPAPVADFKWPILAVAVAGAILAAALGKKVRRQHSYTTRPKPAQRSISRDRAQAEFLLLTAAVAVVVISVLYVLQVPVLIRVVLLVLTGSIVVAFVVRLVPDWMEAGLYR